MRCATCGCSWVASARFCGRCGARLGGTTETRRDQDERDGTEPRNLRHRIAWAAALGVAVTLVIAAVGALPGAGGPSAPVNHAVSIPSVEPDGTAIRAADGGQRPADCGDHLQELPRPIRHYGLYVGTLEWRDGRLCSRLSADELHGDEQPRCEPPDVFACAIP